MNNQIWLLIFGMMAVTYLPRAIPAVVLDKLHFGPRVEKFLKLIPYTAMAALIVPGVFTVDAQHLSVGLVGAAAAALLAWKKCPLMVCVLAAIGADLLLYLFI